MPETQTQDPPVVDAASPVVDGLLELVRTKIPEQRQRLKDKLKDMTLEGLGRELHGTVLPLLERLGGEVFNIRAWAAHAIAHHADVINDLASRVEGLEEMLFSGESQLSPEDAVLFSSVTHALEQMTVEAKKVTTDPAGLKKLDELLMICQQSKDRIDQIEVSTDDEDEDEGEDEGDQVAMTAPAALGPSN